MSGTLVEWSDEYLVGHHHIDTQHRELVRITNECYAGCQTGGVIAKVHFLKAIQGAAHYVRTHFSDEEEIMQKAGYPGFESHKKQHDDFVAAVHDQIRIFENEDVPDPAEFITYLMNWILKHIAEADKKYVPYIAKLQ